MTDKVEYRAYVFVHSFLSAMQKGVQSAHAVVELFHQTRQALDDIVHQWSSYNKTLIILDGGNSEAMNNIYTQIYLFSEELKLPRGFFWEDGATLNGLFTAAAIIVPDYIYNNKLKDAVVLTDAPHPETRLAAILQTHSLAR